jgi:hypothetical protein
MCYSMDEGGRAWDSNPIMLAVAREQHTYSDATRLYTNEGYRRGIRTPS